MTDAAATSFDALPPLQVPPLLPEPARAPFPWLATAAPVAGAVVIWAITGSVVSLAFAALGPLVALAALFDARRTSRRSRRRQLADREAELGRLRTEVARRHDLERAAAWRRTPAARGLAGRGAPAWASRLPETIVVGAGSIASRVSIEGVRGDDPDAIRLAADAALLADAPVSAALDGGIGFVGSPALARASARAAIIQVAEASGPTDCRIIGPSHAWDWLAVLPHRASSPGGVVLRVLEAGAGRGGTEADARARAGTRDTAAAVIAIASDPSALPPGVRTVIEVTAPRHALVHVTGAESRAIEPELLSEAETTRAAERLAGIAARAGIDGGRAGPPDAIALSGLLPEADPAAEPAADRSSLAATVGVGSSGPVAIDLVTGPHALVAGTSGSGKSELLVAWIAAMAARYAPDRVAFLLVDFKGGAAFEPVRALPHAVGMVTDLDEDEAARAVESIRAELRHRERVLAGSGVRSIADLTDDVRLPRLVVVVDEFQAMIERFGELGAVVADVAARGRSLGVHLVLAAQRPNGVVREQVSANCGIRVSLRVLDRADSIAVLGVDSAAGLDPGRPGRALVDPGDGRVVEFQAALADQGTIAGIAAAHARSAPPRRPWLDPLPPSIELDDVDSVLGIGAVDPRPGGPRGSAALLLGVADEPAAQRRVGVTWDPEVDGALVVLGAPGSGRTALLEALALQVVRRHGPESVLRLEGPRSAVWDALAALRRRASSRPQPNDEPPSPRLVLVDDVDLRFSGWPDEYRLAALETLGELMRAGRSGGAAFALAAGRTTALGPAFRDGGAVHVLLRHPTRGDLVHAGGDGRLHRDHAPPGAGQWRGRPAQFLRADRQAAPAARLEAPPLRLDAARPVAVASARPGADADSIGRIAEVEPIRLADGPDAARRAQHAIESGAAGVVIVGDADAWTANWSLAAAVRSRAELVVHGGGLELRALVRDAGLPPLLDIDRDQCWRIGVDRTTERAAWPPA